MKTSAARQIKISRNSMTVCDVRCGPTEDKIVVDIENGTYLISVSTDDHSICVTVGKSDAQNARQGEALGEMAIDGGVLGIYDSALPETVFDANAEDFYEWGDSLFNVTEEICIYRDKIKPFEFACVPTFSDGVFQIVELSDGASRVGLSLSASLAIGQNPEDLLAFQFLLTSESVEAEVWFAPEYDNESIMDSLIDSLEDIGVQEGNTRAANAFIATVTSIRLAEQRGEDLLPARHLDLSKLDDRWRAGGDAFCEFVARLMSGKSLD